MTSPPRDNRVTGLGPRYWRLWTASTTSALGDGITIAALPLLAASLSTDPRLIAGLGTTAALPWLVFSLHAGALVDRFDRRRVLWIMDVVRGVVTVLIAVSVFAHWARLPLLYCTSLIIGFAEVLFSNAAQAIVPSVVDGARLETANGWQYSSETVGRQFAGPPIGALVFAALAGLPFVLDGISFFASAILILSVRGDFRPARPATGNGARPKMRAEIAEGLRWLFAHRLLRTPAISLGIFNFGTAGTGALLVLLTRERMHVGTRGYGLLLAGAAVGSVVGGLVGSRLTRRIGQGRTLLLAIIASASSMFGVGLTHSPVVAIMLMTIEGLFGVCWNVVTVALRQQIIPKALFGRVNSAYRLFGLGMMPLGALAGGFIAHAFSINTPNFVLAAVILSLVIPVGLVATDAAVAAARQQAPNDPAT